MKEYKLYLDESINTEKQIILVAGFAIREKDIDFLKEQIHKAKTILWTENYINSHDTILHCTELATFKNNLSSISSLSVSIKH